MPRKHKLCASLTTVRKARSIRKSKKAEVVRKQRLPVRYHVEDFDMRDRPRRFLEAFAAILKHTNYRLALDHYIRSPPSAPAAPRSARSTWLPATTATSPATAPNCSCPSTAATSPWPACCADACSAIPGLTDEQDSGDGGRASTTAPPAAAARLECPVGIDHGLITHLGRYILSEIGIAPRALVVSVREQLTGASGNTSAVPVAALLDSLEFLSEEMQEEKGIEIPFPIDQEGAEYLFLPAVSDFLMEADTLMGNRRRLPRHRRHLGPSAPAISTASITASSTAIRSWSACCRRSAPRRDRLNVRKLLIGECGHASRTAKVFYPAFCGGANALPVVNILEYTYQAWKTAA